MAHPTIDVIEQIALLYLLDGHDLLGVHTAEEHEFFNRMAVQFEIERDKVASRVYSYLVSKIQR